jgi:hypothetical protein
LQPFRIIFEFSEPVIAPYGVALDGLLAAGAVRAGEPMASAHETLPLQAVEGIWQASELFFIGPAQTAPVPYVRSLRQEGWNRDVYGQGRGDRPVNKVVSRDELKNLLDQYEAIATPGAVAFGVGEIARVEALLGHIYGVGKKAWSRDAGRLRSVHVEPVDADPHRHGLINSDGYPVRALPAALFEKIGGRPEASHGYAVCRLPRWKADQEFCAVVKDRFIRIEDLG